MNTLSLLTLKCAYNTFDLSSGLVHVSIRDQVVRSTLLVRDLIASGQRCNTILIVGAGIAGMCAAIEAARAARHINVVCVDTNYRPFQLQHVTSHRHVGPFMYEWPAAFCRQQHFPPRDWPDVGSISEFFDNNFGWRASQPMPSHLLAAQLENWLLTFWNSHPLPNLKILTQVDKSTVKQCVKQFIQLGKPVQMALTGVDWLANGHTSPPVTETATIYPDFVLLAAGMGKETCELVKGIEGPPFWQDDHLWKHNVSGQRVGIFGGGDGAIQDFLRAASRFEHALALVEYLEEDHSVRELLARQHEYLLSIEQQNRLQGTWAQDPARGSEILKQFDERIRKVAHLLSLHHSIRKRIATAMKKRNTKRDGGIYLYCREGHFGKAYLLNRFLAHLIHACKLQATDEFSERVPFSIEFNASAISGTKSKTGYSIDLDFTADSKKKGTYQFDIISVRFGVNKDTTALKQMLGLKNAELATRTTLNGIPVPFC